jgi:iduronate 2-sulfatase
MACNIFSCTSALIPGTLMRCLAVLALSSFALQSAASTVETAATETRPNVLLILVDDLKPALGSYGDINAISPNIDQLAARGVRFESAYANQAVCMASRYNLMLGSRSTSTGLYNFGAEFREVYPNAVTLPQHFKNNGYTSQSMGKVYHIGHGNDNDEASWTLTHHKEKVIEYLLPESTHNQLTREEAFFGNVDTGVPNKQLPRGAAWESPDVLDEAYADGRVASIAIDRLKKSARKPEENFFMAVGFARPHMPFSAPKKYWDLYDPKQFELAEFQKHPKDAPKISRKRRGEISQYFPIPEDKDAYDEALQRKLIHGYYASMSYMDAQVGRVLDALDRYGLSDNTIVVLWGDHGFHLGDHGIWTKHTNFEQATHIPLIIAAPGMQRGVSSGQLAETVDIYPTLVELAGLPQPQTPQPIDGESLVPVLKNPKARVRDHAYHAFPHAGVVGLAIRTEQYRMVRWQKSPGDAAYELYDLQNDPLETENIAGQKPEVIEELEAILESHPKPVGLKGNRDL